MIRNDNFVRLNLRNQAGACRGARNKKSFRRGTGGRGSYVHGNGDGTGAGSNNHVGNGNSNVNGNGYGNAGSNWGAGSFVLPGRPTNAAAGEGNSDGDETETGGASSHRRRGFGNYRDWKGTAGRNAGSGGTSVYVSKMTGLDPLDEFVDGNFHATSRGTAGTTGAGGAPIASPPGPSSKPRGEGGAAREADPPSSAAAAAAAAAAASRGDGPDDVAPRCARHQRPCKLVVVKKTGTGNKGRKFYACSMPRGEQCDHFQWADDTVEVSLPTCNAFS